MLTAQAEVKITYRSDLKTFRMDGSATIELVVFGKLDIKIGLEIAPDGIALGASLSVNVEFAKIIKLKADGNLYINTTERTINVAGKDVERKSTYISLAGSLKLTGIIELDVKAVVQLGGTFYRPIDAVGPNTDRLEVVLPDGKWEIGRAHV